ncbi:MAG: ATP-dependent zinc metalloprotease FtsH [Fusobacteriaceae bacterium]|nr:ATP-dependent zinc metalloprotease FtsH [Fusobacteriaceae bacterium]
MLLIEDNQEKDDKIEEKEKIEDFKEGKKELKTEKEEKTEKEPKKESENEPEKQEEEKEPQNRKKINKDFLFNKNENSESPKGKFNLKGFLMLLFVITLIMGLPRMFKTDREVTTKTVSYTEFINLVKDKKIIGVEEKEGYVFGITPEEETEVPKDTTKPDGTVKKAVAKDYKARMITDRLGGDANLIEVIKESGTKIKSIPPEETSFLMNIFISWFPMLLLIGVWVVMLSKVNKGSGGGPQIFNIGKSKVKENGENISKVTFDDVAGIDEAKIELEEIVQFLKHPEKFKNVGAKIPKGLLLLGAPGTGKTLLAKAIAGEAGVPFLSMSGSEFVEMFVGVGASRVRDLFAKARKNSPCIVFIDEIDAVGRKRGSGQGGGNDEREQTLNQLLVEMDGFGNEETIIIIAATNRPEVLDRALTRPGRFDRQVVVDAPDIKGREQILKVHAKGKKLDRDVDLNVLARKTPGFVGADLANLLNEAAILAARDGRDYIKMEDLEEASEKVSIGPERKSKVTVLKERKIIAYHEIGHALTQMLLPYTEKVHKVTIVPRGSAALGYTMTLPSEDRYLKSKKEYLSEIRVLLGGRAAEQVIFDDITTGASNDIQRATAIAHAIVTKFGMNEKFGPILLDSTAEGDMFAQKHYSETTGKEIDDEIRKIISDAYSDVIKILKDNNETLEYMASTLLERETITGDELSLLIKGEKLEPFIIKQKNNSETEIKDGISQDQNTTLEKKDDLEESPKEIFTSEKKEELEVLDEKLELEGYELLEEDKVIHKEREKNN